MNVSTDAAVKYFPVIEDHCVRAAEADPIAAAQLVSGNVPLVDRIGAFQRLSSAVLDTWASADPGSTALSDRRRRTLAFYGLVCATQMIDWPDSELERLLSAVMPYSAAIIAA